MMEPNRQMPVVVHWLSQRIVRLLLRLLFRFTIIGIEHVPKVGPVVFGSNHINNLDPIVVGSSTRRQVRFMAKQELFRNRFIGAFLSYYGAFQVKRGFQDTTALRYAIQIPNQGGCVMIFPEGHRSKTGELGKGMAGIALIARKANCPVVPVAVIGPYQVGRPLTVRFGAPLQPDPNDTNETLLEKLMSSISALLAEGHPA